MRIDQFVSGEAVDRLADVLLLVGLDGSVLDANAAALELYGYSHAEIMALNICDIRTPRDHDAIVEQMREADEQGILFETEHRRRDGTAFPVEVRSRRVSADGEVALLSIVFDITERRDAEVATRRMLSDNAQLADAAMALLGCHNEDEVCEVVGEFMELLVPGSVIIVNTLEPESDVLVTRAVMGLDRSALMKAASLVGFEVVGKRSAVSPKFREEMFGSRLVRIPGGLAEFASSEVPRPLAEAGAKLFGIQDVFTIGISDSDNVLGNMHIFTRQPDVELPVSLTESFVRHAYSKLASIRMDRDLAESEEGYAALIGQSYDGIAVTDADGSITVWNNSMVSLTGVDERDAVGTPIWEVQARLMPAEQKTPELLGQLEAGFKGAVGPAMNWQGGSREQEIVRIDGTRRVVRDASFVVRSGTTVHFCTVLRDITEDKRSEDELRDSRALLEESQRVARVGHFVLDFRTGMWTSSAVLDDIYDIDESFVRNVENWLQIIHPDDREAMLDSFQAESSGKQRDFDADHRIIRVADGAELIVRGRGSSEVDDNGEPVRMFGVIQDVTEHRAADEALQKSHDLLENLAQLVPGVIYQYLLYPDGRSAFPYSSPGMNDIYECTPEEVRHDATPVFGRIHPDDYDLVGDAISESARTLDTFYCEFRVILPRQGLRWRWSQANPQRTEDGGTLWHGIISDITERKQAEEALRELNESLEGRVADRTLELSLAVEDANEANQAKTRFLRAMSHELRTPLNSVIGFSSILADGMAGPINEEQHKQLSMINYSGKHLLALINDILDLSRIEAGALEVHPEPIDVRGLVAETVASVAPAAADKNLELTLVMSDPTPHLTSDRTKVHQILLNLVANAVKFTESGSVVVRAFAPSEQLVAFSVTDTGPGIALEDRSRVFGEFERGSGQAPTAEGTGLGLAISRGLAEALGGTVELATELGVGSTFTLTLPVQAAEGLAARRDSAIGIASEGGS